MHSTIHEMTDFFGRSDVVQEESIIAVNEYAYYNGSWSAGQMVRILMNSVGIAKRMFIGAVEHMAKDAWLLMRSGPLLGKQFVIYRNPTILGSSPKADIYLFKDDAIEPRHAQIIHLPGAGFAYRLVNLGTTDILVGAAGEQAVQPRSTMDLANGDALKLGEFTLILRLSSDAPERSAIGGTHIDIKFDRQIIGDK